MRRLQITRLNRRREDHSSGIVVEFFVGDHCPECADGLIGVYCTKRTAYTITRYLECRECGFKPENKLSESLPVGTTS